MYFRVFNSIFEGSLFGKFEPTVTFIGMLGLANKQGEVDLTPEAIAAKLGFPLPVVEKGLKSLVEPDPRSRSKAEEGRRLILIDPERDWGWKITNYAQYQSIRTAEDRREYFREHKAKSRAKERDVDVHNVHQSPPHSTPLDSSSSSTSTVRIKKVPSEPMSVEKSDPVDRKTESAAEARTREEVEQVFRHWQQVLGHPDSRLTEGRRKLIRKTLKDYTPDQLCEAIGGYRNSPHHMGQNDRGTRYDALELILRDAKHIDAGLQFARTPPALPETAYDRTMRLNTSTPTAPEVPNELFQRAFAEG